MTHLASETTPDRQRQIVGFLAMMVIAGGLLSEALVFSTLVMPGEPGARAHSMVSEPMFQARFMALAAVSRIEAYADQAIGMVDQAAAIVLSGRGAHLFSASSLERVQDLLTLKVQMQGDNISVMLFGLNWVVI